MAAAPRGGHPTTPEATLYRAACAAILLLWIGGVLTIALCRAAGTENGDQP